jgi:hypothetical protein
MSEGSPGRRVVLVGESAKTALADLVQKKYSVDAPPDTPYCLTHFSQHNLENITRKGRIGRHIACS